MNYYTSGLLAQERWRELRSEAAGPRPEPEEAERPPARRSSHHIHELLQRLVGRLVLVVHPSPHRS